MVIYITLTALLNMSLGYALAVALGQATWDVRQFYDFRTSHLPFLNPTPPSQNDNSSLILPEGPNDEYFSRGRREEAPKTTPVSSKLAQTDSSLESASDSHKSQAGTDAISDRLDGIQSKLDASRTFRDKSVGQSLCSELQSVVQTQFSLWEKALDVAESDDVEEDIMQKMAHAETALNNIDHIDWNYDLDTTIDSISKQLSMFAECLPS